SKAFDRPPSKTVRPVGCDVFRRSVYRVRHRAFRGVRPKAAPDIVGSTTQQEIEIVAVSRDDGLSSFGVVMRRRPSAVAVVVFLRPAGALNHSVQRDVFENFELSHCESPWLSDPIEP